MSFRPNAYSNASYYPKYNQNVTKPVKNDTIEHKTHSFVKKGINFDYNKKRQGRPFKNQLQHLLWFSEYHQTHSTYQQGAVSKNNQRC